MSIEENWNNTKKWFGEGQNLSGLGSILSGLSQGYAAIEQSKNAKELLDLQKKNYEEELKRRNRAQLSLDSAVEQTPLFSPTKTVSLPLGSA